MLVKSFRFSFGTLGKFSGILTELMAMLPRLSVSTTDTIATISLLV